MEREHAISHVMIGRTKPPAASAGGFVRVWQRTCGRYWPTNLLLACGQLAAHLCGGVLLVCGAVRATSTPLRQAVRSRALGASW